MVYLVEISRIAFRITVSA